MKTTCKFVLNYVPVVLIVYLSMTTTACRASSLCSRCETPEINSLRRYYNGFGRPAGVSFPQFLRNLLQTMSRMPSIAPLYNQMVEQFRGYSDCMMTCDVPFVRKGKRSEMVHILNSILIKVNKRITKRQYKQYWI